MKSTFKKLIIVAAVVSLSIVNEAVYAMVESRPGEYPLRSITANDMFIRGRSVEQEGEALGLTAIVDQYGNEPVSNNIDAHMMKNTEWGAVAYLAQSIYGKGTANNIASTGSRTGGSSSPTGYLSSTTMSTTQNAYGVYGMYNTSYYTYVAAHHVTYNTTNMLSIFNARVRYKDIYTTTNQTDIPGGATSETFGWYGQQYTSSSHYSFSSSEPIITRNHVSGYYGLFSYGTDVDGSASSSYVMRLAIVCGTGL
jgi:hypothetical protein